MIGARVKLRAPSHSLRLKSDTGVVVRSDQWEDNYIIHLDKPARYMHADGTSEDVSEIREDIDNLVECPHK